MSHRAPKTPAMPLIVIWIQTEVAHTTQKHSAVTPTVDHFAIPACILFHRHPVQILRRPAKTLNVLGQFSFFFEC